MSRLPQLLAAALLCAGLTRAQPPDPPEARDLTAQATQLYRQGRTADAIAPARQALVLREKALGPDHPDVALSLNNLALILADAGQFSESEQLYARALSIFEKVRGTESPDAASAADNLGLLYARLGRYSQAESLHRRALAIREKAFGPGHREVALSLNNLAALFEKQAKYDDAVPLYLRAIAIYEKTAGPDHPDTANALNNLAAVYDAQGAFDQADPLYTRALAIREKALGPDHPDTALSLNNIGYLRYEQGRFGEAETFYLRALAVREKQLGPRHPDVAVVLNNLGALYHTQGAHAKALDRYQRALAIFEAAFGPDSPDTARSENNVGTVYDDLGQYREAESSYRRAQAIREKVLGPNHPDVAQSLNNLGHLYAEQGLQKQAEEMNLRALAIYEKALGKDHPNVALSCNNLAELYRNAGDYTRADPFYRRALAIFRSQLGPDHPVVAVVLNNLGDMAAAQGQYTLAEDLYGNALSIYEKAFGPDTDKTALTLHNQVALYWLEGEYAKSEPLARHAVAILEKTLGPDHPTTATALNGLASALSGEKKYAEAETTLRRVLAVREKSQGPEHPDTAIAVSNLAMLYFLQQRYAEADPLARRALGIIEKTFGQDHPNTSQALGNLFFSAWAQGHAGEAVNYLRREVQSDEGQLRLNLSLGVESARLAYSRQFATATDVVLSFSAAQDSPEIRRFAFETLTARKSRVLDSLTDELASVRRRLDDAGRGTLDELTEVRARQARLLLASNGNPAATRRLLDAARQREEDLARVLSARNPGFRAQTEPVTLAAIQRALPAGAVLIEYARYTPLTPRFTDQPAPDRYGAFVVRAVGEPQWLNLSDASSIDSLLANYRNLVARPRANTDLAEAGDELARRLLAPALALAGEPRSLLIAPDAALQLVPWSALPADGMPLMQHYPVSLLDTARDLLRFSAAGPGPRSEGVVIANPVFDATPTRLVSASATNRRSRDFNGQKWDALPGTHLEALALREQLHLRSDQVLEDTSASRAAVRALHGPRFLHIATHGFFLHDQPRAANPAARGISLPAPSPSVSPGPDGEENSLVRSGLVFAGANVPASAQDSVLTALEFSQLDLDGTDLVTLSACETGLGETATGEGVFGLRRAISLAGARSQLISLWKVDDDATASLMKSFYGYLQSGESKAAALNHAQRDVARLHDSPYYWAAFQLAGDPGPVTNGAKPASP